MFEGVKRNFSASHFVSTYESGGLRGERPTFVLPSGEYKIYVPHSAERIVLDYVFFRQMNETSDKLTGTGSLYFTTGGVSSRFTPRPFDIVDLVCIDWTLLQLLKRVPHA